MPPRKVPAPKQVKSTTHADKRTNIPTEELRGFVADDERNPKPVTYERPLLYPRDPDADPQLVWRGKDEQDAGPLTVPAVPLYIQEKIDPRALVEDLRRAGATRKQKEQLLLFEDFDGLEGYEQVEFYEHAANWSNRMILGDALLVMNSMAEKEKLRGQVQMIYVDPPYGIKFGSNWQVSTRKRDVKDGSDASRQPEQVKAFRDTWQDGINSYLTYLRDRLVVARDLLTESGSIFIQMGDENVHLVRSLLDEVFGLENFVSLISFVTTSGFTDARELPRAGDYLLWYAKSKPNVKSRTLWDKSEDRPGYRWLALPDGTKRGMTAAEQDGEVPLPEGARIYTPGDIQSQGASSSPQPFEYQGKTYNPGASSHWKANYPEGMERLALAGRIHVAKNSIRYVRFADDFGYQVRTNLWTDTGTGNFTDDKVYVVQTNTKVIERCILLTTDPGDLVLDPTCGSGTTAFAAEQWGRRWITIDTSRVALALAKTRLMSARYPFYLLADSNEGARKERELSGHEVPTMQHNCDIRHGFIYERVPHVMLGDIARNEKIVPGLSQEEIDHLISLGAEQELLLDRPYEDTSKVRVSGRFTVESLSPHRTLDQPGGSVPSDEESFVSTILENLRTSGVQNTFRGERLTFDILEPYASDGILHAHGSITDAHGEVRTVAVMIGPEHGTVSPDMVKDAARDALKGAGFDILVVCGFAFEAYASETAKEFAPSGDGFVAAEDERRMGRLRVLLTHMNPDLAMSNELLKKTGSGNLFTVFGEPDVTITVSHGEVIVEVHGVDVYDPTTGVVRPSSTDDIACWFIDTDYDGEQFFVRHAYFTGADKPYAKLQRSLNADLDEATWASLYSTRSRPFPSPSTGRIAVKVINHYGDEVLQVYEVAK
ncbi:MAG: site-specific DNA-methyltransferase [Actinomycetota bacterium]|jgi:adenine-specific DNA-methyltransferase|nr:site-specific DNA-methyltransferase [Actinomycetota bacterium]